MKEGKTKAAEELLENLIDIDLNYFWAKHNEIKNNKDIIEKQGGLIPVYNPKI